MDQRTSEIENMEPASLFAAAMGLWFFQWIITLPILVVMSIIAAVAMSSREAGTVVAVMWGLGCGILLVLGLPGAFFGASRNLRGKLIVIPVKNAAKLKEDLNLWASSPNTKLQTMAMPPVIVGDTVVINVKNAIMRNLSPVT